MENFVPLATFLQQLQQQSTQDLDQDTIDYHTQWPDPCQRSQCQHDIWVCPLRVPIHVHALPHDLNYFQLIDTLVPLVRGQVATGRLFPDTTLNYMKCRFWQQLYALYDFQGNQDTFSGMNF